MDERKGGYARQRWRALQQPVRGAGGHAAPAGHGQGQENNSQATETLALPTAHHRESNPKNRRSPKRPRQPPAAQLGPLAVALPSPAVAQALAAQGARVQEPHAGCHRLPRGIQHVEVVVAGAKEVPAGSGARECSPWFKTRSPAAALVVRSPVRPGPWTTDPSTVPAALTAMAVQRRWPCPSPHRGPGWLRVQLPPSRRSRSIISCLLRLASPSERGSRRQGCVSTTPITDAQPRLEQRPPPYGVASEAPGDAALAQIFPTPHRRGCPGWRRAARAPPALAAAAAASAPQARHRCRPRQTPTPGRR